MRRVVADNPSPIHVASDRKRLEAQGLRTYNAVVFSVFEEMKSYIGFGPADAEVLSDIAPCVQAHLPGVVDNFYAHVIRHPAAARVLAGGEAQVARLRGSLLHWLESLFSGVYDEQYVLDRAAIGQAHVRVGLPQHFMFTAMEIIWQDLSGHIRGAGGPNVDRRLTALHKLLTLETGLMLENYRSNYSMRIRELEREAIHERLSRAEHLAEIGQLAASLAHEIKNPLAGISGAIQVIRDELSPTDSQRPILDEIMLQIGRVDGTVKDLLSFARPPAPHFRGCDLTLLIDRVATLLRQEPAFRHIGLEYDNHAGPTPFEADERQIEQLLINLLLNAAHASKSGQSVRLRVSTAPHEVVVVVEDKGHGMDADVLRRAFEPFYTTKARGTGLGLPICRKIVDGHSGSIRIDSEIGRGTAVEVTLPRRRSA